MAEQDLEQRLNAANDNSPSQETETGDLEKAVEQDQGFSFGRAFRDVVKFTPHIALNVGVATYFFSAPFAPFLTPIGLSVGRAIANHRKKKETKYNEVKNLSKIGMYGATAATAAYAIPDYFFPGTSVLSTFGRVAIFDGVMVPAWLLVMKPAIYIADKFGFSTKNYTIKGPQNFYKGFKAVRKEIGPQILETFLTLSWIHFLTFRYVSNVTARMAIGTGNDILLSMILGEKGLLKTIKEKFYKPKPANDNQPLSDNVTPPPQQEYQTPQPYRQAA